jgi:hypothetical protein
MKAQGKTKDWLVLSAYLDGELNAREKEKLERRLHTSPLLREQLSQLKITRSMIRSLPRKKVPRNFVLSPEMVKQRKSTGWLPLMGLTSAASAILALVLLFFQFAPGFLLNTQSLMAKNADEVAMYAEADSADSVRNEGTPEIIYWGGPPAPEVANGKGGGNNTELVPNQSAPLYEAAPAEGEAPEAMEAPAEEAPQMEAPALIPGQEEAPPAEPTPEMLVNSPEIQESTEESLAAPQTALGDTGEEGAVAPFDPILGIRPTEEAGQMLITPENAPPRRQFSTITLTISVVILLAGISLATGLAAFFLWRRFR